MRGFLSDCHKIETLAGEIYQRLAVDAAYAPEVRSVFQKLGGDERAHARQIDLVMQAPEKELDAVGKIAWESIDAAVQLAEGMVRALDHRCLGEEEALRLAVEMEQQFVKVHVNNAMHFYNQRLAALFAGLGAHDQEHLDRLRECLKWWHSERKPRLRQS
ncbi:MAG: hypothetical protein FIB02_00800 [Desulfuromonas sp.]|nr:hypothetical protein [Desulfuromonas sp.]